MSEPAAIPVGGRPRLLDVLGSHDPWPVPPAWLDGIRGTLRGWADDPETLRAGEFRDFVDETPAAVWYTAQIAAHLGGFVPVLHGDLADLGVALTSEYARPRQRVAGGHVIRRTTADWPLRLVSGARNFSEQRRQLALELSRDAIRLFVEAPPLAERAETLVGIFERVLSERELIDLHCTAPYPDIATVWRTELLREPERAVLPELAGGSAALSSALARLARAHADLAADFPDDAEELTDLLASLLAATGVHEPTAQVSRALGDDAGQVTSRLSALVGGGDKADDAGDTRDTFDVPDWLARNTAWLTTALRSDSGRRLARTWAGAATEAGLLMTGITVGAAWPPYEVPDLSAFFAAQDGQGLPAASLNGHAGGTGPDGDATATDAIASAMAAAKADERDPDADSPALHGEIKDYSDDPMAELDSLIGLKSVKDAVHRLVAETKADLRRREVGLPTNERARHMVFVGKPGTAKTTIARLLARIYKDLGVLEKGHCVEVDRSDLVGAGVGTTAPLTAEKFNEALGGVLFIDEAYSLVPENSPGDFGLEAVATVLKMMEDHRDDVIVIAAGYHREMQRFLESNTGLTSRFPKILAFSDYTDDQLVAIFELIARQKGFNLSEGVLEAVREVIPRPPRSHTFGNGRFMRNVYEETVSNQSSRLVEVADPTEEQLRELRAEDVSAPTSMRAVDYLTQAPGT